MEESVTLILCVDICIKFLRLWWAFLTFANIERTLKFLNFRLIIEKKKKMKRINGENKSFS